MPLMEAELREYLEELREEVCRQCAGRPEGAPLDTPCGLELPLAQLTEALLGASGGQPCPRCPCPKEKLVVLAEKAAEALEERRRRLERLLEQWNDG
jgi:hypothetical protein